MVVIGNDWDEKLSSLFSSELYANIREFLKKEYSTHVVYPSMYDIFNAFKYTPYNKVKAVILGQDPYHGEGQAHGLCFSVKDGVALPPSLVNIYKEMQSDLGIAPAKSGCLTKWAENGVMLLNTTLTVRAGQANSHSGCGWQQFTDEVIKILSAREKPMVFILWGATLGARKNLSTQTVTSSLNVRTLARCPRTTAFSGVNIFPKPMISSLLTAKRPSIGTLSKAA